jgi:hypothetical protein
MYYSEKKSNSIIIREVSGAPHFEVSLHGEVLGYNLSGNILSISYKNNVEVYDVQQRSRIR